LEPASYGSTTYPRFILGRSSSRAGKSGGPFAFGLQAGGSGGTLPASKVMRAHWP
jgi:hypothetical protein